MQRPDPVLDRVPGAIAETLDAAPERFEQSVDGTLGIEEEFAILDPATLDLAPRYEEIAAAAIGAGMGDTVTGELIASEVEFRTGRCEDHAHAREELTGIRAQVAQVAASVDALVATSGTHPWADYREQTSIGTEYYSALTDRMAWAARRNNTFGLHVHVGVQGADRAARVADALRTYIPELLALSASSPFLDGIDTGMASMRAMIFSRNFPRGNVPPLWGDWAGYDRHVRWLASSGSITSIGQQWWGVRMHPLYGTVELRMFDGQPDVADTLGLAALASGVVMHLADLHDAGELPDAVPMELIEENHWRALRYGTACDFVQLPHATTEPASERIGRLIEQARASSSRRGLDLDHGLDRAAAMLERGSSALGQRAALAESGADLASVYRSVAELTMNSATVEA